MSIQSRKLIALAGAMAFAGLSVPVSAALVVSSTACANTDITPGALACSGFFQGNLLGGSPTKIADQQAALALIGFAWDGNFSGIEKIASLGGSFLADFVTPLNGITYVGFHFGAGGIPGPGGGTAFYKLDAGTNLDVLGLFYQASSGAALYSTGRVPVVPEPETWAMMIAGMGLVGCALRRRKPTTVTA